MTLVTLSLQHERRSKMSKDMDELKFELEAHFSNGYDLGWEMGAKYGAEGTYIYSQEEIEKFKAELAGFSQLERESKELMERFEAIRKRNEELEEQLSSNLWPKRDKTNEKGEFHGM